MVNLTYVNDTDFQEKVLEADFPVLVDFYADWCAPCKMIEPWVEQVAGVFSKKLKVFKVNVDKCPMIASTYHIMNIPTLLIFKDGAPVSSIVGAVPYKELEDKIVSVLEG